MSEFIRSLVRSNAFERIFKSRSTRTRITQARKPLLQSCPATAAAAAVAAAAKYYKIIKRLAPPIAIKSEAANNHRRGVLSVETFEARRKGKPQEGSRAELQKLLRSIIND